MKKFCTMGLALVLALSAVACGKSPPSGGYTASASDSSPSAPSESSNPNTPFSNPSENIELIVFAAASMTETLEKIASLYANVEPNVKLVFNFDSSGTLKTQIQEGAVCDLFISAGQKQMNELDITASAEVNTEGLGFILKDSRIDLLENRVTLVVPEGNPADINSYSDGRVRKKLKHGILAIKTGDKDGNSRSEMSDM